MSRDLDPTIFAELEAGSQRARQDTLHERMQEPVRELPPWLGFFLICGVVGAAYVIAMWVFAGPPQITFNPWSR